MTRYISESNAGKGELKAEYIAYRIVEFKEDGSWRFVEGNDGYDYATFRNASKTAKWMNDYYVKWGQKYRFQVKQVKVTVEVTQ